jgi:hypothetical protein
VLREAAASRSTIWCIIKMTSSSARALGLALGLGLALFPELASGLWRRLPLPLRLELARSLFPEDMMALRSLQKMRSAPALSFCRRFCVAVRAQLNTGSAT